MNMIIYDRIYKNIGKKELRSLWTLWIETEWYNDNKNLQQKFTFLAIAFYVTLQII